MGLAVAAVPCRPHTDTTATGHLVAAQDGCRVGICRADGRDGGRQNWNCQQDGRCQQKRFRIIGADTEEERLREIG